MDSVNKYSKRSAVLFIILAVVFSAVIDVITCITKNEDYIFLLMWMPALAGLIASFVAIRDRGERVTVERIFDTLNFHKCKFRYVFLGCFIPLVYLLIPYVIFWCIYPSSLNVGDDPVFILIQSIIMIFVGTVISMVTAIGEEIGWRGFEVPSLIENWGLNKTLVFSSALWCLWHFPILLGTTYMEGTPVIYKLVAFILTIFPVGIICGLLTYKSKSIWPAALIHAAHNNYDQAIFGIITESDIKMYFVSETGILTMVFAWAIAIWLYLAIKRNPHSNN